MNNFNELQNKLNSAIELVKNKNYGNHVDIGQLYFEKERSKLIESLCTDKMSFMFYSTNYNNALNEARQNKINSAENYAIRAKKHINISQLSDIESDLYRLIKYPIDSYLFYKNGEYEKAIKYADKAILLDHKLEQYNSILFYHKIQQLHNLARINIRTQKYDSACEFFNKIFMCLIAKLPVSYNNIHIEVNELIEHRRIKWLMIAQVFNECVYFLDEIEDIELKKHYFLNCFNRILDDETKVTEDNSVFTNWIKCKYLHLYNNKVSVELLEKLITTEVEYTSEIPLKSLLKDVKRLQ